jgi:FkbH-like protein
MRLVRDQLNDNIAARPHIRLRLTGTSTTHSLAEALRPAFAHMGLQAQTDEASFGALIPELMSPVENSNALVVLLDAEDFSPKDWRKTADEFQADLNHRLSSLTGAIKYYCNTHGTPVLINTLPASAVPAAGHIDRSYATGTTRVIDHVNRALADAAQSTPLMQLVDADHALAAIAPDKRTDPRLWHYGRLAYSEASTRAFAQAFALAWQARTRGPAKVLALDFDNTLWGGVYGDDGIEKLACGDDFPGNAYKALQQECLRLKSQGMLLVGLSKNNPDAIDVFANHPGIVLTRQDFAAMAINWEPKPNNIVNIARDLGLGLDSFVFLDDSAHEREAMRRMCPSVTVPEMPNDASRRPLWLRSLTYTWPLRLTDEDARRSDMYQAERNASELRAAANSYEEYLAGLEQQLTVEPVRSETLARAAQLHQRTNQFNLSNRRYDESQIKTFMTGASGGGAFVGRVKDRFGNHGIVLAACTTRDGQTARIESFVMSCRVIGRQIETAFLQSVIEYLKRHGAKRIEAIFRPTAKNSIASGLYPSMGFFSEQFGNDEELWVYRTNDGAETGASSVSVTVEWEQA